MKDKIKLRSLELGGFLASILPLLAVVAWNWSDYTQSVPAKVKLCCGGVIAAVLILLKVLGKLKLPGDVTVVALVMVLAYLLDALLKDLTLLCGAYLLGFLLERLFFRTPAKRLREKMQIGKQADATAGRVEELLQSYLGNGRV